MKKILIAFIALILMAGISHSASVKVCTLTFTNITTVSTGATSCTGRCKKNTNCAIDVAGAIEIQTEWIPNATTHTASDWDVEIWVSKDKDGPFNFYTDAATAVGALATIGGAADTQYDVTNPSGNTFRYTFDGTGTDPTISATDPAVGSTIAIAGFATANNGVFTVSAAGTNYFEVYNTSGSAETNITSTTIVSSTDVSGSVPIATGPTNMVVKISENGALRADVTVDIIVTKQD